MVMPDHDLVLSAIAAGGIGAAPPLLSGLARGKRA